MLGNQASQQDLDLNQSHKYTKNWTTIEIKQSTWTTINKKQNTWTKLRLTESKARELNYDSHSKVHELNYD